MDIEEAQEMMRKIYLERDMARGVDGTLKRTFDELEELRDAIQKEDSKSDIADVFAWLCSIANLLEIDISESFYRKYSDVCSKCKNSPCDCPADH